MAHLLVTLRFVFILSLLFSTGCGMSFSRRFPGSAQSSVTAQPSFVAPRVSISETEVGVVVNDNDAQSVLVASYYISRRGIPDANVVHLKFPANVDSLTSDQFAPLKAQVDARLGSTVQALALTWTRPYLVQCSPSANGMSITSAFTLGYDTKYCNTTTGACAMTAASPLYNQETTQPFTDFRLRPAMMLAGQNVTDVSALIDRGITADAGNVSGTAYLIRTTDSARSVRYPEFQSVMSGWNPTASGVRMSYTDNSAGTLSDFITGKTDVLFYFTGLASVPQITTNRFVPGAIADHLTSFGGQVPTSSQMSAVAWLQAGATASYGTVVEPCAYTQKFPNPQILIPAYFRGASAVEAYWRSVEWPGEGLFVGDPLARPFMKPRVSFIENALVIQTTWMKPGLSYRLQAAESLQSPYWSTIDDGLTTPAYEWNRFVIPSPQHLYYRLVTP